ncbi:MAG: hypothetical protein DLM72_06205 [Candidatus Nitrosopolaris wilkensis]|nr:MAG: hypothetical protein DLM72_06205 [Candidatus Nitrosopolaris wilkensis]
MNHNVTLAIVAVVAAMTLTAVAFAIPQQALAYRHHNNHNNHKNSIKVDQQVNQQNSCNGVPVDQRTGPTLGASTLSMSPSDSSSVSGTVCLNQGDNSVDIHK